jgi:RNA polymerase sigma factor (sigma-70 family)
MSKTMSVDAATLYSIARQAAAKLRVKPQHRDDCIQDAVCAMLKRIANSHVDFDDNWRGYLYMIALSAITNYHKRHLCRWGHLRGGESLQVCEPSYRTDDIDVITANELVNKLPSHYKEVIVEYFWNGKTTRDIADERGVTVEAIGQVIRESLRKMRLFLERYANRHR